MREGVLCRTVVVTLSLLTSTISHRCDRTPEGHVAPKIPADNRFQLKVSGSPDKYVPGESYMIHLQGLRNHGQVAQKFTGFMLVVEAQNHMPLRVLSPRDVTPRPVGTFNLYGDTLTKFSPNCPNMVTHTSTMPKSEVQVEWLAPEPGSGCVIFRATVIEHRDVWYQDDGPLSKMLCEEQQESQDSQPAIVDPCCACDEAKYEVTFEGLWSRHTHPKDFPSNSWLTRFSDVIGASHSSNYRFWTYGGVATDGLMHVAERGATRTLESELKAQSQNIRTIIKARGISYPNVTGKTFAVFRVDKVHHLMSLVSMIDPSPDWIVGVSALELCLQNCSWIESRVLNLYPWDAGTDSGVTYISPDQPTFPRDNVRRITSSFPNDPRSPFYDQSGAEMKPLARLYLTRQRLYEKTCDEEPMVSMTGECAMTEWTPWGSCSATCGPGKQHRQRSYRNKNYDRKNCPHLKLTDKRGCFTSQCRFSAQPTPEPEDPYCEVSEWADWSRCQPSDSTCTRGTQNRYRQVHARDSNKRKYCMRFSRDETRDCRPSMSPSICPKNGRGKVVYKDPQSSTCCAENDRHDDDFYGSEPETDGNENDYDSNKTPDPEDPVPDGEEKEYGNGSEDDPMEEPTGDCAMTNWSEWSPCSAKCGVGETRRFRQLLNPPEEEAVQEPRAEYRRYRRNDDEDYGTDEPEPEIGESSEPSDGEYAEGPCSIYKTQEVMACNGTYPSCQFSNEDVQEICALPPHPGRCPGPFLPRWYYNPKLENCAQFDWSGCRGNNNRFLSEEECITACQAYTVTEEGDEQTTTERVTDEEGEELKPWGQMKDHADELYEGTERPVRDCKFSRWSEWSKCNAPCNQHGLKVRTRFIEVHAKNGGKDCLGKTRKQKKCFSRCKPNEDNENEEDEDDDDEKRHRKSRCKYSEWSEWTECTATCGYSAIRQRTRMVLAGSSADCSDRIRKRDCNVGPCPQ